VTNEEIFSYIDHTALKAVTTRKDIDTLCEESLRYKTASVCIPPSYIEYARKKFGSELNICTVIGFPLGYCKQPVKIFEAQCAVEDGSDEVDMVINLGDVKNGDFDKITDEIRTIKFIIQSKILKVIVETCYLTTEEKIALCKCVTDAGADFIKTSTGFGTAGAAIEDIRLFREHIGEKVKIKAAGGIKTREEIEMYIAAGCDRIGTSSAVKLLAENS
jgi:deoxyribose-phosphate aldolase